MSQQITIKDLARILNVSVATVSRAMRDMPDIHPDTKKAVLDLAEELDYQPNSIATSLVKSKTKTIGLVVPDLGYYFFSTVMKYIEEAATAKGYSLFITQTSESYQNEIRNIQNLIRTQVEGIIISLSRETENFDHLIKLQKRGLPMVFFDRDTEEILTSKVLVDNVLASKDATRHLIDNGAKRIAFMAGPRSVNVSNQRVEGYKLALLEAGMQVEDKLIVYSDYDSESARKLTKELMAQSNPPDAIVIVSDRLAIGVAIQLREMGIQIPDQVMIVSFNNEPICEAFSPSISSVSQPLEKIGKLAIDLLIEQIENKEILNQNRVEILPTELIIRESSKKGQKTSK
ncbi:MAG: hypothetical protein RIR51_1053 [Bacteroidota bacterium]